MMPQRRELQYSNWDEILSDLKEFHAGYQQAGKWNLEQTALHLNDWLRFPMDGYPKAPLLLRILINGLRITVGKRLLNKIISQRKMQDGAPTIPETAHPANESEDPAALVQMLTDTIIRFRSYDGAIHPSPLFGAMDKTAAENLHLVHFAHHLSWLSPTPSQESA